MGALIRNQFSRSRRWRGWVVLLGLAVGLGVAVAEVVQLGLARDGEATVVSFAGSAEGYGKILASDDLEAWEVVGMVLGTGVPQGWVDPNAAGGETRFYRVEELPVDEPGDVDGDGFDDVFELTQGQQLGLSPLSADQVTVATVTVGSTAIAAGALDKAPYQTEVTVRVEPPGPYPVVVWLEGGEGHGSGVFTHFVGGEVPESGPARLEWGGQSFVAGGPTASEAAMVVTPNAQGEAVLVLSSSNQIGEQCTVHARVGTRGTAEGAQAQSPAVSFEKGLLEVELPGSLIPGGYATAVLRRSHNGMPLAGHRAVFFVSRVRINGLEIPVDPGNPGNLDAYATISPGEALQVTDANGTATADVLVGDFEGLEKVVIEAQDLEVFGE